VRDSWTRLGTVKPGYRALAIASPKFDSAKATFAAEIGRSNGPFDHPDSWDKYKLWNKVTVPFGAASSVTVGEMSYAGNWNGSGQIPPAPWKKASSGVLARSIPARAAIPPVIKSSRP